MNPLSHILQINIVISQQNTLATNNQMVTSNIIFESKTLLWRLQ